jgi:hypothetical protein
MSGLPRLSACAFSRCFQKFSGRPGPYGDSVMIREFRDHPNRELAA